MTQVTQGQLRRVRDAGDLILVTDIYKIAILHGEEEMVSYLAKGEIQTTDIAWVLLSTDLVESDENTQCEEIIP